MGKASLLFLLVLVVGNAMLYAASGLGNEGRGGEEMEEGGGGMGGGSIGGGGEVVQGEDWFLLRESVPVVQTYAGNMRVVKGIGIGPLWRSPMHIGFITMEPNSLLIPQYLDSTLILFVRRGEARIGHIYKDDLAEKRVKTGDVYIIPAGSAFYIVNTAEGLRLQIICSIDTSESLGPQWSGFQSFFVGGGMYPTTVLAGFDRSVMAVALNITEGELGELLGRQMSGQIVYLYNSTQTPSVWSKFMDLEQNQRLAHLRKAMQFGEKSDQDEEKESRWSWRKLLLSVFGDENRRKKRGKGPDSYNLYDRKPDFKNGYGWSKALDESDYSPLRESDIGVYLVRLKAGSMMAPHINPKAAEFGIVLEGNGTIQIVYPNGTMAMSARVSEGDLFWVPRYFPFCQIASRTAPFEFFGFTTSARKNWPQFLVGRDSLLRALLGPELAAGFGLPEERLRNISGAQRYSVILPSQFPAQPGPEKTEMKISKMIKNLGNEMIMDFD